MISHLQYADDTIIFCPGDYDCLRNWWDILNIFMLGPGLSINLSKTSLIGINVEVDEVKHHAASLGCKHL